MSLRQFPNFNKFSGKNILAIDYGTRVTGTATFCPGKDPFPLLCRNLTYQSDEQLARDLKVIIEQESVDLLVLGLPLYTDGSESDMTQRVLKFGTLLKSTFPLIEHYLQDETLTSYEAEDRMKNSPQFNFKIDRTKIDMVAASIILEDFIKS